MPTRRTILGGFASIPFLAGAGALFAARANPYYTGPVSAHILQVSR